MDHQSSIFDQCRTQKDIQAQLQRLARELAAVDSASNVSVPEAPDTSEVIALNRLAELSYADVKECQRPVFLLSEICRLLFKTGDRQSLRQGLLLSHAIYAFQCGKHESWYVSSLYKGIAQIGLNITDLGVKNVSSGLAGRKDFTLVPLDRALGYWALMSAAIANKNLKLALSFADQWLATARQSNLSGEVCRAQIAFTLLHLLYGDTASAATLLEALRASAPAEWQPVVLGLEDWLNAMQTGRMPGMSRFSEPYPLLLGIRWQSALDEAEDPPGSAESAGAFPTLCRIRREYGSRAAQQSLSAREVEAYANFAADWELPCPLYEFERLLKHHAQETYMQSGLSRIFGRHVLRKVFNETPLDPDVIDREDAIVWVMDVRDFSKICEKRSPSDIFELLNPVFKIISEELETIGGAILEFIGDSLILVFNTFSGQQTEMSAILSHTIRCLQRIYVLNAMSSHTHAPEIRIGVGMHTGPLALGYLGGLKRCHVTVLGAYYQPGRAPGIGVKRFARGLNRLSRMLWRNRP